MTKGLSDSTQRLEQIQALGANWNGYGVEPIPASVISTAREVVPALQYQPLICPTARGSVQLEYEQASDYLEIELFADGTMGVFRVIDGSEHEHVQPVDIAYINVAVNRFCC